jgi:hypothetical protein
VSVFDSPVCPHRGAGGVDGEHGVRHVVGGFAGSVSEASRGVAFEARRWTRMAAAIIPPTKIRLQSGRDASERVAAIVGVRTQREG